MKMEIGQQNMQGLGREATKDYNERQLVVFNLGSEEFGVNINEVNSILKMSPITRIPNAQDYIEGVINLRGQIMVVIDLAKKLGLPQKERDKNTRIIVIETSETMVGMIVDHSREVIRISEEQIQPPPALITQKVKSEYLEGVAIINKKAGKEKEGTIKDETIQKREVGGEELNVQDSRLLILLDLAKILNSEDVETAQMAQNQELQTEQKPKEPEKTQPETVKQEETKENTETIKEQKTQEQAQTKTVEQEETEEKKQAEKENTEAIKEKQPKEPEQAQPSEQEKQEPSSGEEQNKESETPAENKNQEKESKKVKSNNSLEEFQNLDS